MAQIRHEPPNPDEIRRISALAPPYNTTPASNAATPLSQLLHVCGSNWVPDFLFSSEPIHLPFLSSTSLLKSAVTCDITVTRAEHQNVQPDPNNLYERQHLTSRYLFAPACTIDNKTVGFGVMDGAESRALPFMLGDFNHFVRHLYNVRFLYDAVTRVFITVSNAPEHDCIVVYYSRQLSTTSAHSFTARFKRSLLLKSLKQHCSLPIDEVATALIYILEENHRRSCPFCKSTRDVGCSCVLPQAKTSNPAEFAAFKDSFALDFGLFEGFGNRIISENGQQIKRSVLGVRALHENHFDLALVHRLSKWSVSEHAKRVPQDPLQAIRSDNHLAVTTTHLAPFFAVFDDSQQDIANILDEALADRPSTNVAGNRSHNINGSFAQVACSEGQLYFQSLPSPDQSPVSDTSQTGSLDIIGHGEWDPLNVRMVPDHPQLQGRRVRRRLAMRNDSGDVVAAISKMVRANLRKDKNRKSAEVCNLRNALMRKILKSELQYVRGRTDILRQQEMNLRNENMTLRSIVHFL